MKSFMQGLVCYSPFTGKPIESQTVTQIVDKIKALPKSLQFIFMPVVREKIEYKRILIIKKEVLEKLKLTKHYTI